MQSEMMGYVQMFFRRKQFFLYPFIITLFFSVVVSLLLPKIYESNVVVLVEEEKVINPLISGLAVSRSVADRLRVLRSQILGWENITQLVKTLNLDKDVKSTLAYEQLINRIRKHIIVELKAPQIIKIAYQGRNPEQVQLITKTLLDIFIQQNIKSQSKETDVAVAFLKEQLKLYRTKIKQDEIDAMGERLEKLLIDSTEKHPMVKNLKGKIKKLKAELAKNTFAIKPIPEKKSVDKEVLSYLILKELKNTPNEQQISLPENLSNESQNLGDHKDDELSFDTMVNRDIYAMLLQRLETARITQQLESFKEGTRFTVIDPARLPLKPIKPNLLKILLLGIGLGVGTGYACVYLVEMIDTSFRDTAEAKETLKMPVLGAISVIITEKELSKRKQSVKFSYFFVAIVFILIVGVVLILSFTGM
ncbi:MAG: hypothetical protein DRP78_01575 [Candidatus Omnitrophota bacterium]|nr:MAG: hypothetical protein DRP78_01575 [Candidatus Omnitrophota bacterium]